MYVLQYACLIFLGGFENGKQKDLRRLHQPWQRGVLHEVQAAQKRIQGFVCGRGSCSGKAADSK